MDSTEAKELVNNLRKAKNASSPYYWAMVLEGDDGEPCLFFEKKEAQAKKKAKDARKTAKKKKVSMGIMDYSSGKMVLKNDGGIGDAQVEKAIKKLIKAHSELTLLKKLSVDSKANEEEKDESTPKETSSSKDVDTIHTDDTNIEISHTWAAQWEAKYQQAKEILKTASKSSAAKKDKVKAKIEEYKERLKTARKSFNSAIAPFDEATRTRLDDELETARKSILKMAERLNISIPPLENATSDQEKEEKNAAEDEQEKVLTSDNDLVETILQRSMQTDEEKEREFTKQLKWSDRSALLLSRLDQAWESFDKELDRFQTTLLNHPEVSSDPRAKPLLNALSNLESLLPVRSSKLHKYLNQLGSVADKDEQKVLRKKALKFIEKANAEYSSHPVLTYIESNSIGKFPAQSTILSAFSYIETILNA